MPKLNADQITLLAYYYLREEVMDGGFIQLIHNGLGGFIFLNPFARAIREWGLPTLSPIINGCHKLYKKYREELEKDYTDEEFMALFEKYPDFDKYDDAFVESEEEFTEAVARYNFIANGRLPVAKAIRCKVNANERNNKTKYAVFDFVIPECSLTY